MNTTAAPSPGDTTVLPVEIYSDVVCPWCYIGKRRFESALDQVRDEFAEQGLTVEVRYLPYQLDPKAPIGSPTPVADAYARKFGGPERAAAIIDTVTETAAGEGLEFRMDRAVRANTILAHRLLWYAEQPDVPVSQHRLKERLLQAYFVDGLDVGDPDTLVELAADVGFDADDVRDFLESGRGTEEVRELMNGAIDRGVTAVPTYVLGGGWAIPGAQEPDTFAAILRKVAAKLGPGA